MRDASARKVLHIATAVAVVLVMTTGSSIALRAAETAPSPAISTSVADLVSVEILKADPFDSANELLGFCFDSDLSTVGGTSFSLVGYNAYTGSTADSVLASSSATVSTVKPKCAEVQFASGTDVHQYSLGAVADGATKDMRGFASVQASAPLQGSALAPTWGNTTAPELTGIKVGPEPSLITYVFDENLDTTIIKPVSSDPSTDSLDNYEATLNAALTPAGMAAEGAPAASHFAFWDDAGATPVKGREITSVKGNELTVGFCPPAPTTASTCTVNVASTARVSVDLEALIADRQKTGRNGQKNLEDAFGTSTSHPDLAGATKVPGTSQIDFDFDEIVSVTTSPGAFVAYTIDGKKYPATQAILVGDGRVRASFPDTANFTEKVVRAGVLSGVSKAVTGTGGSGDTNLAAFTGVGYAVTFPGFTDGPDLAGLDVDEANKLATFHFDTPIQHNISSTQMAGLRLVDKDAHTAPATGITGYGDKWVTVSYQGSQLDFKTVVGGTVNPGSVLDFQGKGNPVGTIATGGRIENPPFVSSGPPSPTPPGSEPNPTPSGSPSPSPTTSPTQEPNAGPGTAAEVQAAPSTTELRDQEVAYDFVVVDSLGNPVPNVPVTFSSRGIGEIVTSDAQSDLSGVASVTVSSAAPGTQKVEATVQCAAGECSSATEVRWVVNESQLDCTIVGSLHDDVLKGTTGDDVICGFGGGDVIEGGRGDDVVFAGGGDDTVRGGGGNDVIRGEAGKDILIGDAGHDALYGGKGKDSFNGGSGKDDICVGTKSEKTKACES